MFARNSIHIPLKNREGDQFVLTDEHAHFNHERLEFLTGQEAWDFIFALTSSQALQQRLKGHPSLKSYHQAPLAEFCWVKHWKKAISRFLSPIVTRAETARKFKNTTTRSS